MADMWQEHFKYKYKSWFVYFNLAFNKFSDFFKAYASLETQWELSYNNCRCRTRAIQRLDIYQSEFSIRGWTFQVIHRTVAVDDGQSC